MHADLTAGIAAAEGGGDWPKAVALRLRLHDQSPSDIENVKSLVSIAEQSGQLASVVEIAKTVEHEEYRDLYFSLPLIRFAVRHNEFRWAEQILAIMKRHHAGNEWPIIAEAELLHKTGQGTAALAALSSALPTLNDTYAFLNISDCYYKLLNEPFSDRIDPGYIDRISAPALVDTLYVGLIKDEEDIIYANLKHHYRVGFRYFVLLNNDSQDGSESEIKRFRADHPDALVFVIFDPITGYVQDSKTTAAMHFAVSVLQGMQHSIRWVFAIDADEFICTSPMGLSLQAGLERLKDRECAVLTLVQVNAASGECLETIPRGGDVLSLFDRRMSYPTLPVFKVGAIYQEALRFDVGNHRPNRDYCDLNQTVSGTEFGFFLLHMPLRSVRHARSKVLNGIAALNAASHREGIGGHWRRWHEQYQAKGAAFFEELLAAYVRDIGEHDARRRT